MYFDSLVCVNVVRSTTVLLFGKKYSVRIYLNRYPL